jgi:putative transposase
LIDWVAGMFRFRLQPVLRSDEAKGFVLLPRRWVVERTFGWLSWSQRLGRHHESYLLACGEAFVHIAMIRIMLNRLD